jgi:hypothetical protein
MNILPIIALVLALILTMLVPVLYKDTNTPTIEGTNVPYRNDAQMLNGYERR